MSFHLLVVSNKYTVHIVLIQSRLLCVKMIVFLGALSLMAIS